MSALRNNLQQAESAFGKDSKQYLEFLALEVGEVTRVLISVESDLFKSSLRRIVPIPFFFKLPPYENYVDVLRELALHLADIVCNSQIGMPVYSRKSQFRLD